MPRMQLEDHEVALIQEHRRKTEIDRTHNAALDLALQLAKDVIHERTEGLFNEDEEGEPKVALLRSDLYDGLNAVILKHTRSIT